MGVEDTKNPVDKEIIEANPVKTEITQEELLHSLPHEIELMELKELATIAVEITKDTLDEVSAHNPTNTSLNHGCLSLLLSQKRPDSIAEENTKVIKSTKLFQHKTHQASVTVQT